MKTKLIKCTGRRLESGDEWGPITEHIANVSSDWEDISILDFAKLKEYVERFNSNNLTKDEFYLIVTDETLTIKQSIQDQLNYITEILKRHHEKEIQDRVRKELYKKRREERLLQKSIEKINNDPKLMDALKQKINSSENNTSEQT